MLFIVGCFVPPSVAISTAMPSASTSDAFGRITSSAAPSPSSVVSFISLSISASLSFASSTLSLSSVSPLTLPFFLALINSAGGGLGSSCDKA
eukprot:CCRYP_007787-RC/>CCRYP_007787-RC protein AED:0.49 eAED:1.00 QI:0/0/0/1/0/0/2/0/92